MRRLPFRRPEAARLEDTHPVELRAERHPGGDAPPVDVQRLLDALRAEAMTCRACPLYEHATQTVFGEGRSDAPLVLLGEQPGDVEDREGHPFVGPAGRVLDRVLDAAGIVREQVYVSNVVKHFKWSRSGKVRLHKKPNAAEIRACRQWWEAELEVVRPRFVCCLGVTAAQALFGPKFRVTQDRGIFFEFPAGNRLHDSGPVDAEAIATIHPSARAPRT